MNKIKIIIMMILLLQCALFSYAKDASSDDTSDISILPTDELLDYETSIKNGYFAISGKKDRILAEGNVKNSKKEGEWKIYYTDSDEKVLKSKGPYHADLKNGQWVTFYPNSKTWMKMTFRNGVLNGPIYEYSIEGVPVSEGMYNNNVKNGVCRIYFPDGNPKEITMYHKGQKDGIENLYYPNGKRISIGTYKNGIKNGLWKYYYETGKRKAEGNFKNNEKTGKWKIYDENEKIVDTESY